jgi:hypothetical protein
MRPWCAKKVSQEGPPDPEWLGRQCFASTAHDILVDFDAEGMRDLLAMRK